MKQVFVSIIFFCIVQCPLYANTYVVDNTADTDNALAYTAADGTNTLRKCIRLANANAGADIINFSVAGTITLTSNLPALSDVGGVTINGNTAPGYVVNPNLTGALAGTLVVTISGANLYSRGITISNSNNVIRGLNFINVGTAGGATDVIIDITSGADNNKVLGCYIGTTLAGTGSAGTNTEYGVRIVDGENNQIGDGTAAGRNLISGMKTSGYGIRITGTSATAANGNTVKGNIIGLQQDGVTFLATTQQNGVHITLSAVGNTIGGTAAGAGNVISGNTNIGIYLASTDAGGNTVLGNIIGPQADGITNLVSNSQEYGVAIIGSPNNVIGGSAAGAINIISANTTAGVYMTGAGSTGNSVKGNYIGLDINGTTFIASSNQDYGVNIETSAASNTIGGTVAGEGNVISGNITRGIYITSAAAAGNSVLGNIIGLQADGATIVGSNSQTYGVYIDNSPNNTIGGNSIAGAGNIISGNDTYGVYIYGSSSANNIRGNYIGLQSNGTSAVASSSQNYGVFLEASSFSTTIGGLVSGEGNVISGQNNGSGSGGYGIYSESDDMHFSYGNIIGPQANGSSNIASNAQDYGIYLEGGEGHIIGGSSAEARNIISANLTVGIYLNSKSCIIEGNYIGLDITGTTFISGSSQDYGIEITNTLNTIGGAGAGEENVISGNVTGIYFTTADGSVNTVIGNIIGPQADGASNVASNTQTYGIYINGSPNNTIGGTIASGAGNIISANLTYGIYITGAGSTGNSVKGNYLGLDNTGTNFIAGSDQDYGVQLISSAASNIIGGTAAGEGNVISGNITRGIYITSTAVAGNSVLGNIIGPQANGTSFVTSSVQAYGIMIFDSPNNIIGGSAAGARNTISGNITYGVTINGAASTGNLVKGNYIGLDNTGTTFIAGSDQDYGVRIETDAASNTIGGTVSGERNVISGNDLYGIYCTSAAAAGNTILGNIIGPQVNGTSYVTSTSQNVGIYINGSRNNTIGGNTPEARNIISANLDIGISIEGASATGNMVKGNYIGLNQAGTARIIGSNNTDYGVKLDASAASNTIGGSAAGEGNVISGNTAYGVIIVSTAVAGNSVLGNIIGPQADGITLVPSNIQAYGVYISDSPNNIIGNIGALEKNIISANNTYGVAILGAASTGNLVRANYIGPSSALASIGSSSQDYGVYITTSAANNRIGGSVAGQANTVAFNTVEGIYITSLAATGNLISRNPLYTNTGKQINLNYGASQGNNGKATPVITTITTSTVVGTSGAGNIVEVFKNTGGACDDAVTFVGSATADGSGNWSLGVALAAGDYVIANATDGSNNTSEFSPCIFPLPVKWLHFNAIAENNSLVRCEWATATEMNNDYFAIERSQAAAGGSNSWQWEQIGTVKGAGNSSTPLHYEFIDTELPLPSAAATLYYRLRQVDYNGQYAYSAIRQVKIGSLEPISIYPSPSSGDFTVSFSEKKGKQVLLMIRNALGQEFYSKEFIIDNELFIESINLSGKLASGVYTVIASSDNRIFGKRVVIK